MNYHHQLYFSILFFFVLNSSYGQEKYGYFYLDSVKIELPQYVKEEHEKVFLTDSLTKILQHKSQEFALSYTVIEEHREWTTEEIDSLSRSLENQQKSLQTFQLEAMGIISDREKNFDKEIKNIIAQKAISFCEAKGITYIFPKQTLIYQSKENDYTSEFIKYLKTE
ncbi:OmpH family outer membrane protein [Flammeovirga sp. MY04]|uniref:OmpH family outer membrane protein n=1 Tax=Flammeovirga sp. MY04 TaxID=1191459 RepID=UPI0008063D1E|nr:OmpH family outer membrane protein [Flammeovirga sp. MY04]ANQ48118.1 OmpH family outer membrane protein [Flammeovirga sp. MY04]